MPIGTILPYIGDLADIPKGWHLCDGSDGTPNLLDNRFLEGSNTIGIFKNPGLPNITGSILIFHNGADGAFYPNYISGWTPSTSNMGHNMAIYSLDASKSSSIYGNSTTVQPRSYTVYYIIKMK